ncbi:MAG: anaerobic ribonucleoside-triphosphate reductase activating protein [Candidatus Omnitrophota bacterium]
MRIGGLQKFSLLDYPDKVCCIIFTRGCDFRCPYCFNPELVDPHQYGTLISEEEVWDFLENRKKILEAVVISGGEPTLQPNLISFIQKVKQLGYLVKLNTNGSKPHILRRLIFLKAIDYIAMDVKAPLNDYAMASGVMIDPDIIRQSINIIIKSGIRYEFRVTVAKSLCSEDDLKEIKELLRQAETIRLQKAVLDSKILDKSLSAEQQYTDEEFEKLKHAFEQGAV